MARPGRVCLNNEGQWISIAQASGGGRRVGQDLDFARDMCVSCDMGLQGRSGNRRFLGEGEPGKMSSRLASGMSLIFDMLLSTRF